MEITYVIQKSRRRSMSIQVADDKKVIVKVPLGTPTFVAENFIREKKNWITKKGRVLRQIGRDFLQAHLYPPAEVALGKLFCRRESKLQLPSGADAAGNP